MKVIEINSRESFQMQDGSEMLATETWCQGERLAVCLAGPIGRGTLIWFNDDPDSDEGDENQEVTCLTRRVPCYVLDND